MLKITIKTGNSAFEGGNKSYELARILRKLAEKVENGIYDCKIMDVNGNTVGKMEEC
jgi:hypothetical protein